MTATAHYKTTDTTHTGAAAENRRQAAARSGTIRRVTVRPAHTDDTAQIVRLSQAVGQTGGDSGADRAYLGLLLRTGTVRVAADASGTIIGWGAVSCGPLGSLLTDLFVDPDHHGRGVGAAILRELWPDHTAPGRFTFSSQHENALPLYARAGLRPTWPLLYLSGNRAAVPGTGLRVEKTAPAVAAAADSRLATGDRSADYAFWTRNGSGDGILVRDGQRVVAAGVLRGGDLVHLTSAQPEALAAALAAAAEADVTVCLPGQHPSVVSLLRAGFLIVDYDIAMSTPDLRLPEAWAYSPGLG